MIDRLEAALDKVCSDASTFTDGESIERLYRCLSRLEAAATVATAAFEAGGEWRGGGARSVAGVAGHADAGAQVVGRAAGPAGP